MSSNNYHATLSGPNVTGRGTWDSSKGSLSQMLSYFNNVLSNPGTARNDPDVPFSQSIWDAASAAAGTPLDARSLYNDARYAWAKYATVKKFDAGNVLQFFKNLANGEPDTGTVNTASMGYITQVFGYETIRNTNMTANSGVHGPSVKVGIVWAAWRLNSFADG